MKRIAIINNECFRDTDVSIIEILQNDYIIDYYIILDKAGVADQNYLKELTSQFRNFHLYPVNGKYRRRSLHYGYLSYSILKIIKKKKYHRILTGIKEDFFLSLLFFIFLKKDSIIYMLHDADVHPEGSNSLIKILTNYFDRIFIYLSQKILLFSEEQLIFFKNKFKTNNAEYIEKPSVFYGIPKTIKPDLEHQCRFLFFGNISYYKNIEVLIKATEKLNQRYANKFVVSIIGGSNYNEWKQLIQTPSIYNCDIRRFKDDEIPNIFESHHFLVLPYKQVTQSGPYTLSLQYSIPSIASNLEGFKRNIIDKKNGFLFEPNNIDQLTDIMEYCILLKNEEYNNMRKEVHETYTRLFNREKIRKCLLNIIS